MVKHCGLCGHAMTSEACGSATSVGGTPLCHHTTHSCYRQWTVYGVRPSWYPDPDPGSLSEDEERDRSERPR